MLDEKNFDTGEVVLNYAEGPQSGPPLVLLHGFKDQWSVFQPMIPPLAADWSVYAVDFRGQGKSGKKPGSYRYRDYYQDVESFIQGNVDEPAVLLGHSLGGIISIMYAARHPEKTRAIVVLDAFMNFRGSQYQRQVKSHFLWDVFEDLSRGYDSDELLPLIACPVLLLRANPRRGGLIPDEDLVKAKALIKGLRYVYYDDLGHQMHKENPSKVLKDVTGFLGSVK